MIWPCCAVLCLMVPRKKKPEDKLNIEPVSFTNKFPFISVSIHQFTSCKKRNIDTTKSFSFHLKVEIFIFIWNRVAVFAFLYGHFRLAAGLFDRIEVSLLFHCECFSQASACQWCVLTGSHSHFQVAYTLCAHGIEIRIRIRNGARTY